MEWIRKNRVKLYTADDPFTEIFVDDLGYYRKEALNTDAKRQPSR